MNIMNIKMKRGMNVDYEKQFSYAKISIAKMPVGTEFIVKDLFLGAAWNNFSRGEKISFGRYFSAAVKEGKLQNISCIGRKKNNTSLYKKI